MKKFLGIAIISVIVAGAFVTTDAVGSAIDLMALIFVLGIGIGHSMSARANESAITRFGDGCVRAGWLGLLVGLVIMTSTLEPRLDAMLPAIAVALLTPLYGYFFKILAMQLD
ncbi:MAG: hypothetical protein VW712_16920 [Paracoccaceae bacterium]